MTKLDEYRRLAEKTKIYAKEEYINQAEESLEFKLAIAVEKLCLALEKCKAQRNAAYQEDKNHSMPTLITWIKQDNEELEAILGDASG